LGKINIQKIDTKPRKNNYLAKLVIIVVIFILIRVLKSKGKSGVPLIWRIFNALRGVKLANN
jgi:hypothetical protein